MRRSESAEGLGTALALLVSIRGVFLEVMGVEMSQTKGSLKIEVIESADSSVEKFVLAQLRDFNLSQAGFSANYQPLVLSVRNDQHEIIGGICGKLNWGWLYIDLLWVKETERGSGLGVTLLRSYEEEARKRGCRGAHLFTYSFQAPEFYKKNGYTVFASIDDYPEGHQRLYLKKLFGV
jgi:GNAT superfamily N-acetyltransferase